MSTTTLPERVVIDRIDRDDWDGGQVASGQGVEFGALGFAQPVFQQIDTDEHPAFAAWDEMVEEIFEELHPKIRDLFYEAISARLPFVWEPER